MIKPLLHSEGNGWMWVHSQHRDAPVFAGPLASRLEARQADQGHGGSDGQRSDVLEQDAGQAQRPDAHLHQGRHDDGPLDLTGQRRSRYI